jgi:hypothetical protein
LSSTSTEDPAVSINLYLTRVRPTRYRRLLAGVEPWHIPDSSVSLGKSWSVLYRFLNFQHDFANPSWMAQGISGGEPFRVGDYNGPRALSPRYVARVAEALMGADDVSLVLGNLDRYRAEARILDEHVDRTGTYGRPLDMDGVAQAFVTLRDFYRDAALAGDAAVIALI